MPKEIPRRHEPLWRRKVPREVRDLVFAILAIEVLIWTYVISSGLRDLRRQVSAVNFTIDALDLRLTALEDEVHSTR